ncbi:MAG: hypothetical protein JJU33_01170 [Phycisphaerales bacterium]|nr:hypothetical protein [Phycisphaerales bacterium]
MDSDTIALGVLLAGVAAWTWPVVIARMRAMRLMPTFGRLLAMTIPFGVVVALLMATPAIIYPTAAPPPLQHSIEVVIGLLILFVLSASGVCAGVLTEPAVYNSERGLLGRYARAALKMKRE